MRWKFGNFQLNDLKMKFVFISNSRNSYRFSPTSFSQVTQQEHRQSVAPGNALEGSGVVALDAGGGGELAHLLEQWNVEHTDMFMSLYQVILF